MYCQYPHSTEWALRCWAMRVWLVASVALCVLAGQKRQGVVEASSRSVDSGFDTNIGVFSPSGRLLQLDYVEVGGLIATVLVLYSLETDETTHQDS